MSLQSRLALFISAVGADIKSLQTNGLTTNTAQTVTGVKQFAEGALLMRNAAGTKTAEPYSDVNPPTTLERTIQSTTPATPTAGESTEWTTDGKSLDMIAPDGTVTRIGPSAGGGGTITPLVAVFHTNPAGTAWTNMPSAVTELYGVAARFRMKLDLTNYTQCRLICAVSTAGASTAEIRIQYSTNGDTQSAWSYMNTVGDGPKTVVGTTGGKASAWTNIVAGAQTDTWFRVVGINGDAALDPIFGTIALQVR